MSKIYPGKIIGQVYAYKPGKGVYVSDDNIISSICGHIEIENLSGEEIINVIPNKSSKSVYKPEVGDEVYCRITKIFKQFTNCEIIATKTNKIYPINASINSENVKPDFKDFDMFDCFTPGDIVLGKIISTDSTNSVFISTTDINHGVVLAKSLLSSNLMMPVTLDKMLCLDSMVYESRKVAKPEL